MLLLNQLAIRAMSILCNCTFKLSFCKYDSLLFTKSPCYVIVASSAAKCVNTLRPRRNEQHFADDIFKRIFFNENVWISIEISLRFVPRGPINNIPALVQIMAWRRPGDKPLSEPMMGSLLTHICVTRPQWVNVTFYDVKVITKTSKSTWAKVRKMTCMWLRCSW